MCTSRVCRCLREILSGNEDIYGVSHLGRVEDHWRGLGEAKQGAKDGQSDAQEAPAELRRVLAERSEERRDRGLRKGALARAGHVLARAGFPEPCRSPEQLPCSPEQRCFGPATDFEHRARRAVPLLAERTCFPGFYDLKLTLSYRLLYILIFRTFLGDWRPIIQIWNPSLWGKIGGSSPLFSPSNASKFSLEFMQFVFSKSMSG